MRQQLDIYASLVICKTLPGYPTRHKDVDFAIIRENTEGEYSGLEHQVSRRALSSKECSVQVYGGSSKKRNRDFSFLPNYNLTQFLAFFLFDPLTIFFSPTQES